MQRIWGSICRKRSLQEVAKQNQKTPVLHHGVAEYFGFSAYLDMEFWIFWTGLAVQI